jgi:hypothetical protein
MFSGLFQINYKKISFEDLQYAIKHTHTFIIINTLPAVEQDCLIKNTISYQMEEKCINDLLNQYDFKSCKFIIYGKNAIDESVDKKYKQLSSLGFAEIYIYVGGLFEWMLLQDIYGFDEFPTTRKVLDILKYKPARMFGQKIEF